MLTAMALIQQLGLSKAFEELIRSNTESDKNPYHNIRHALWVAQAVHNATQGNVGAVMAALYHDWGHPGGFGNDKANVEKAAQKVLSLDPSLIPVDDHMKTASGDVLLTHPTLEGIAQLIRATEFPMDLDDAKQLTLNERRLRDADTWSQALMSPEDFVLSQIGLGEEAGKLPHEWFEGNVQFFTDAPALSPWGEDLARNHRQRLVLMCTVWAKRLA